MNLSLKIKILQQFKDTIDLKRRLVFNQKSTINVLQALKGEK